MNELTNMRLFALLSEPSQTESNEQMECAYGNFVEHIEAVSSSSEYANIHRTLNITRIELAALENIHRYEQGGENALKKLYLQKALSFLDSERELLLLKIRHPEQFTPSNRPVLQSSLSVISKFPNLGIMGMTEILISLHLLGGLDDDTGKKPSKTALANVFQQAFGFSFNSLSDCQRELFKRKPYNVLPYKRLTKKKLIDYGSKNH